METEAEVLKRIELAIGNIALTMQETNVKLRDIFDQLQKVLKAVEDLD